ncbi:MAG: type II secretion system minor pseudopilin GspH [Gammaproteobacteria bacterium]|nr:type II secretion system minor pseudopilin GspH [Gammaproteobacteria bacterium]
MRSRQRNSERGFTLLELLLVIVIVAIVSAAVVITMNPDNTHRELETEARRLTQVLRQLADESIFQGQEFGVIFKEGEYSFSIWDRDANQWQNFEQPPVYRTYALPEPFVLVFDAEEIPYSLKKKSTSSAEGNAEVNAAEIAIDANETQAIKPNVWFLSSGEITPFSITVFSDDDNERRYLISANAVGEIFLQTPNSSDR